MPTIARLGPYRVYYYSHDAAEPPHVHIDRDANTTKFWLDPVANARNIGFRPHELRVIERLVRENADGWLENWRDSF